MIPADVLLVEPPDDCGEIVTIRHALGLTQAQAAALADLGAASRWSEIESGRVRISAARWTLFLLAVARHPRLRCWKKT